jgi:hypothetical protein
MASTRSRSREMIALRTSSGSSTTTSAP